jgi:hypothetical protein
MTEPTRAQRQPLGELRENQRKKLKGMKEKKLSFPFNNFSECGLFKGLRPFKYKNLRRVSPALQVVASAPHRLLLVHLLSLNRSHAADPGQGMSWEVYSTN